MSSLAEFWSVLSAPQRHASATTTLVASGPAQVRAPALAYRPDIDGLRALAVAMVIAYHALPQLRGGGFIGVDVFFVISGYLITQIILAGLHAGTFSLGSFYQRRVRRIVPALLLVVSACTVFGWYTLFPSELQVLGWSTSWCASFLANVFFARAGSGYFDAYAASVPLLHLWSLGVEEQFYFGWPVLLLVTARCGVTLRVLLLVTATSLAISIWGIWHAPLAYFYLPASRAWELAAGGVLAARPAAAHNAGAAAPPSARRRGYLAAAASLAGMTLIAVVLLFGNEERVPAALSSVVATAGALLLITAGPLAPLNRQLLGSAPMIFLGRISYPLYLWHWPLFSFTRIMLGHALSLACTLAAIVLACAAAYATHRWVEKPLRHGRQLRWKVPALLAGLAILALAGAALGAGWIPARLSGPAFAAWDAAVTDWHYSDGPNTGGRHEFLTRTVSGRADRTAVFIGDSHMQQYWPRVVQVVKTHAGSARTGVLAVYYECPPLPGINSGSRGRDCAGFFDYAVQLASQPGVDTVVFGAFWEKYLLGEYLVPNGAQPVYRVADPDRAPLQLDSRDTPMVLEQFRAALATLVARGRRVFVVLSNPTSPQYDPASMLPAVVRLSSAAADRLPVAGGRRIDAGAYEAFVEPLTERLSAIAAGSGAQIIDPRATLCSGLDCPATGADGLPLYLDSNHLRAGYARERASFVDELLLGP
jgi:peptidoglycan/LPS O-acetylase OafA/YrhL